MKNAIEKKSYREGNAEASLEVGFNGSRLSRLSGIAIFLLLSALVIAGSGCASGTTTPDPMIGWHLCKTQDPHAFSEAMINDYRAYVETMPAEEKRLVDEHTAFFFEDGTGQHAVRIAVALKGVWRAHLLIYDKDNKRVKAIRYNAGRYAS
jgi:hypothetical protein